LTLPLFLYTASLNVESYTVDLVKNVLGEIISILRVAVDSVNGLAHKEISAILGTVTSVLSIVNLGGTISTLIQLIFGAIGVVIKVVAAADKDVITPLLGEVVYVSPSESILSIDTDSLISVPSSLIGELLQLVCSIFASTSIISLLLPILTPCVEIIKSLGVTEAFAGLGLPL
jgi:hypothetical protein